MTWNEFKTEVEKQIQKQSIPEDTTLLYIDLYPGEGISVEIDHDGTFSIS